MSETTLIYRLDVEYIENLDGNLYAAYCRLRPEGATTDGHEFAVVVDVANCTRPPDWDMEVEE